MCASPAAGGPARRRRAIPTTGSVRNAVAMRSPAATSTISSHRGRPPTVSIGADRGCRRPLVGVDGRADAGADACAGGRADADAGPTAGAVAPTDGCADAGDLVGVDAGCDAGEGDGAGCDAAAAAYGIASTVPVWIASGSGPIPRRLAAYSAGQPPGVPSAEAMPDRVSPALTV